MTIEKKRVLRIRKNEKGAPSEVVVETYFTITVNLGDIAIQFNDHYRHPSIDASELGGKIKSLKSALEHAEGSIASFYEEFERALKRAREELNIEEIKVEG